jgi:hypothetical protein
MIFNPPPPDWTKDVPFLPPGTHVITITDSPAIGVEGRKAGLQLRDALLILQQGKTFIAFLFRKPISEPIIIDQVLKTETGALNIDGCRIYSGPSQGERECTALGDGCTSKALPINRSLPPGRWPTNLVFIHHPECQCLGTKSVKGIIPGNTHIEANRLWSEDGGWKKRILSHHANPDGTETVPSWNCHPNCPVRALNEQSGERRSAGDYPSPSVASSAFGRRVQGPLYTDSGSASRFFPQFTSEGELHGWLRQLIAPEVTRLPT